MKNQCKQVQVKKKSHIKDRTTDAGARQEG